MAKLVHDELVEPFLLDATNSLLIETTHFIKHYITSMLSFHFKFFASGCPFKFDQDTVVNIETVASVATNIMSINRIESNRGLVLQGGHSSTSSRLGRNRLAFKAHVVAVKNMLG